MTPVSLRWPERLIVKVSPLAAGIHFVVCKVALGHHDIEHLLDKDTTMLGDNLFLATSFSVLKCAEDICEWIVEGHSFFTFSCIV
jgi:hypothetical protein